jgi:hypothetical protein
MKTARPLFFFVLTSIAITCVADEPNFIPKNGYVPDDTTAIKIALAVLEPIYGRNLIENEKPFKATLNGETWSVTGTLKPGHLGGTAIVELNKQTGCIVRVIHEK